MTRAVNRREALSRLAALFPAAAVAAAIPAIAAASSVGSDHLTALCAEWRAIRQQYESQDETISAEESELGRQWLDVEERIIAVPPATSAAGALVLLEIVRMDFVQFHLADGDSCLGDRFTLAGLDQAIHALRVVS